MSNALMWWIAKETEANNYLIRDWNSASRWNNEEKWLNFHLNSHKELEWFTHCLKITRNDQSRMNEEVYEDCQERVINEKKLSNHQQLNKVYSSMWQEEQDHQKTETQWILRNHAERWTILERTVQNCEMSKKCSCRHIDLSDNFSSGQVKMLQHHYDSAK